MSEVNSTMKKQDREGQRKWTCVPSSELLFGQGRIEVHADIRGRSKPSSREVEMIPALETSRRHSYQDRVGDWFLEKKKWQERND